MVGFLSQWLVGSLSQLFLRPSGALGGGGIGRRRERGQHVRGQRFDRAQHGQQAHGGGAGGTLASDPLAQGEHWDTQQAGGPGVGEGQALDHGQQVGGELGRVSWCHGVLNLGLKKPPANPLGVG